MNYLRPLEHWDRGFNPTPGTDVCARLFCVRAVLRAGKGFTTGLPPVQGVLPTV
jgi:hypothetical protein